MKEISCWCILGARYQKECVDYLLTREHFLVSSLPGDNSLNRIFSLNLPAGLPGQDTLSHKCL